MGRTFGILDCTLRDGGYSNDWHFDKSAAAKLFELSEANGCNYFELGFRFPSQGKSQILGPFAFSRPSLLNEVTGGKRTGNLKIGFMINADDFAGKVDDELGELLGTAGTDREERFDFVRVATRLEKLEETLELCSFLLDQGYQVMVNLMQAHRYDESDLKVFAELMNSLALRASQGFLSHIYLADTMGALTPKEVSRKVATLVQSSDCEVGFHGHDNLRLALANSLAAAEAGASLIDGTVAGMGRGIGNTRVELLYLMRSENFIKRTCQI